LAFQSNLKSYFSIAFIFLGCQAGLTLGFSRNAKDADELFFGGKNYSCGLMQDIEHTYRTFNAMIILKFLTKLKHIKKDNQKSLFDISG